MVIIISSLSQAGINTSLLESSFNLFIGGAIFAFALGYGLSAKDVMANTLASFHNRSQYKVGQKVRIDQTTGIIHSMNQSALFLRSGRELLRIPMSVLQHKTVVFLEEFDSEKPEFDSSATDNHTEKQDIISTEF